MNCTKEVVRPSPSHKCGSSRALILFETDKKQAWQLEAWLYGPQTTLTVISLLESTMAFYCTVIKWFSKATKRQPYCIRLIIHTSHTTCNIVSEFSSWKEHTTSSALHGQSTLWEFYYVVFSRITFGVPSSTNLWRHYGAKTVRGSIHPKVTF